MGLGGVEYHFRLAGEARLELPSVRVTDRRTDGGVTELTVRMRSEAELDGVLGALRAEGASILHCAPHEPDLEDVFHELVRDADEEDAVRR